MGYKIGFSIGYGIVFLAYKAIVFLLTGFTRPGAWLGLACTVLVLGLCLAAVWKDAFQAGIAHLPMVLGVVLTIFFVLQLAAGVIVTFLPLKWGAIVEIVPVAIIIFTIVLLRDPAAKGAGFLGFVVIIACISAIIGALTRKR